MAATGQGVATTGGGEGQAQGEGAQQNGQAGVDFAALNETLSGLASGQEEMRTFLQGLGQQQPQTPEAPAEENFDLSFLFPDGQQLDQFGNPVQPDTAELSSQLAEVIKGTVSQQAQQLLAPIQEKQERMRREQEARDLAGEFPELSTAEMAEKIAGRGGLAEQAAQQLGMPQLAAEPKFWRLVYGFHKAAESANQPGADPAATSLETGGGAGPAQVTEAALVKQITGAGDGLGARVLDGI